MYAETRVVLLVGLWLCAGAFDLPSMYGQFCGPGGTHGRPVSDAINLVDIQCWKHDRCWETNGNFDLACDRALVSDLLAVLSDPSLSTAAKLFGNAAAAYFAITPIQYVAAVQKALEYAIPQRQLGQILIPFESSVIPLNYDAHQGFYRGKKSWRVIVRDETGHFVGQAVNFPDLSKAVEIAANKLLEKMTEVFRGNLENAAPLRTFIETGLSCSGPGPNTPCTIQFYVTSLPGWLEGANAAKLHIHGNFDPKQISFLIDAPVAQKWYSGDKPGPKYFAHDFKYDPYRKEITLTSEAHGWGNSGARGHLHTVWIQPLFFGSPFPNAPPMWQYWCRTEEMRTCDATEFDPEAYAMHNQDVVAAQLSGAELLCCHFNMAGKKEGRQARFDNREL